MSGPPRRKRPRLKGYDYSRAGEYFVTICTKERRRILGTVGRDDLGAPRTCLSPLGAMVERYILQIPKAYAGVSVERYVVMPNHIHILLAIHGPADGAPGSSRPTQMVPRIVAALKRLTNREAGQQLWQPSYHDHIIRDESDFLRRWSYIESNPARWAEDEYYDNCEE